MNYNGVVYMFSGIPEIFTQTPVESIILSVGLKIQLVLAQFVKGTPALRNVGLIVLVVSLVKGGYEVMNGKTSVMSVFSKAVGIITLYLLSMTFISYGSSDISFNSLGSYSSSTSRPWLSYSKVNTIEDSDKLSNATGLYWYLQIYSSIQQLSNGLTQIIADAFSSPHVLADPSFFMKQMAFVSSKGLADTETAKSLDDLMRDCSDTHLGKKLDVNSNFKDIFDLTHGECQKEWDVFQSNVQRVSNNIESAFSPSMVQSFSQNGISKTFVANYQTASAILNYVNARAGYTDWRNNTTNDMATYTNSGTDKNWQMINNPVAYSAKYISNLFGGKDSFLQENRAEISTIFNKVSAYIPQLRAYTAAILAILFVPVALVLGCGQMKFFTGWLSGVFMLAMYQPASAFVYKLGEYASSHANFISNSNAVASDPMLLVASKLLDSQISQILVVTMIAQIGLFLIFVIGSIKFLSSAMSISGRFSDSGISAISHGMTSLSRAFDRFKGGAGGAPGMDETNIHVHTYGGQNSPSTGNWSSGGAASSGLENSNALTFKNSM